MLQNVMMCDEVASSLFEGQRTRKNRTTDEKKHHAYPNPATTRPQQRNNANPNNLAKKTSERAGLLGEQLLTKRFVVQRATFAIWHVCLQRHTTVMLCCTRVGVRLSHTSKYERSPSSWKYARRVSCRTGGRLQNNHRSEEQRQTTIAPLRCWGDRQPNRETQQ